MIFVNVFFTGGEVFVMLLQVYAIDWLILLREVCLLFAWEKTKETKGHGISLLQGGAESFFFFFFSPGKRRTLNLQDNMLSSN